MNATDHDRWLKAARKLSTSRAEAEDLLHDALLVAARSGKLDLEKPGNAAWFRGVLKNLARNAARSASRRRQREHEAGRRTRRPDEKPCGRPMPGELLRSLPRRTRQIACLILHGMKRKEITKALQLTDSAFRQRLTALRRDISGWPDEAKREALGMARLSLSRNDRSLELGLMRKALQAYLHHLGQIGTHDPDGHLIVISRRSPHKSGDSGNR